MPRRTATTLLAAILLSSVPSPGASLETGAPKTLRIGLTPEMFSGVNLRDAQVALQVWVKSLSRRMARGYSPEAVVYPDLSAFVQAAKAGSVDLINLASLDYLQIRDVVPLDPVVVGVREEGRPALEYVLLTRRNSAVSGLENLQGKGLTIGTRDNGRIAELWLDVQLLGEGLPESRRFLKNLAFADKPSQAVMPVFFGQIEACIVTAGALKTMVEMNPQLDQVLVELRRSPRLLEGMMCFPHNGDWEKREVLLDSALQLHSDPEGQQVLTLFGLDRAEVFEPSYLDNVEELVKEYDILKERLMDPEGDGG
jgi:phosphonate transport system substrate-binding protein